MAKTSTSTRDRIVDTCRRLFNDRGPVAVTTAEIAATVGINEGNLYYYFKTKEQMLLSLFDHFERALASLATVPAPTIGGLDPQASRLQRFFDVVWAWRFMYRDSLALVALAPSLRGRIKAHAEATQASLQQAVRDLVERDVLAVPERQLVALCTNTWIICTYWIQYLQFNRGVNRITRRHLAQGYDQVRALYLPYVVVKGKPSRHTGIGSRS